MKNNDVGINLINNKTNIGLPSSVNKAILSSSSSKVVGIK